MVNENEVPLWVSLSTYFSYAVLIGFGHLREYFRWIFPDKSRRTKEGYAPLLRDFDDFYTRRLYFRIRDSWNRPIDSRAGPDIQVVERVRKNEGRILEETGKLLPCLNLASYNYLGFAHSPEVVDASVQEAISDFGISLCSAQQELGVSAPVKDLEEAVASFLSKEDAVIFGMGFATNSTGLPAFADNKTLYISDNLNHSSLVQGCRGSNARTRVFKHNDMTRLESIVRDAVVNGDKRRRRPYSKIIIVVEGIYSMEGEILDLPTVIAIKKRYNCYLYLDEAHSIGALGKTGRGVVEYWMDKSNPTAAELGVPPISFDDIDVMMGTFTKSFGGSGGYIAGTKQFVDSVRQNSPGTCYANMMSPVCAAQALTSLKVIAGEVDVPVGQEKLDTLRRNTHYFRDSMNRIGVSILGDYDSPVVPILLYQPAKMPAFSRECLKRGLAVVVVGYPATPLIESRVRVCLSSALTMDHLDRAISIIDEVSTLCNIKYKEGKPETPLPTTPVAAVHRRARTTRTEEEGKKKK